MTYRQGDSPWENLIHYMHTIRYNTQDPTLGIDLYYEIVTSNFMIPSPLWTVSFFDFLFYFDFGPCLSWRVRTFGRDFRVF